MAKQTRSTRRKAKAKAKTMRRRKAKVIAKAKTIKKPQRRTRLGLMKRKRFTRKVKGGGFWEENNVRILKESQQLKVDIEKLEKAIKIEVDRIKPEIVKLKESIRKHPNNTDLKLKLSILENLVEKQDSYSENPNDKFIIIFIIFADQNDQ